MSIQDQLSVYDHMVLAELGNEGLVRRATKMVEKGDVSSVSIDEDEATVKVTSNTVTIIPTPLEQSSCDCSAVGFCVHIIAGVLFLQNNNTEGNNAEGEAHNEELANAKSAKEELLSVDPKEIIKWGGKAATKKSFTLIHSTNIDAYSAVEENSSVLIQLNDSIKARYLRGGGLNGIICEAPESKKKTYIMVCLLYWLKEHGVVVTWPEELMQDNSVLLSSEESRHLERVIDTTENMLKIGIGHLGQKEVDVFSDLALQQESYHFPKLNSLLVNLAGALKVMLSGSVESDSRLIVSLLTKVWMICIQLLESTSSEKIKGLRGTLRTEYVDENIGPLWFSGGYTFSTKGGAIGLSVCGWDIESGAAYNLSITRKGESARGFDPEMSLNTVIEWENGLSAKGLIGNVVYLERPKVNEYGVLSQSSKSRLKEKKQAEEFSEKIKTLGCSSWSELAATLASRSDERVPTPFLLRPKDISQFELDEIYQVWKAQLTDSKGIKLNLGLPVNDLNSYRAKNFNQFLKNNNKQIFNITVLPVYERNEFYLVPVSLAFIKKGEIKTVSLEFYTPSSPSGKKQKPIWEKLIKNLPSFERVAPAQQKSLLSEVLDELNELMMGRAEMGIDCRFVCNQDVDKILTYLNLGGMHSLDETVRNALEHSSPSHFLKLSYSLERTTLHNNWFSVVESL